MPRSDLYDNNIRNPLFSTIQRYKPLIQTISGPITLLEGGPGLLVLNPGTSALNVTLYTPVNPTYASFLMIVNSAAATGTLVIKNAGGTTIGTLAVGGLMELVYVNGAWLAFQTAKSA